MEEEEAEEEKECNGCSKLIPLSVFGTHVWRGKEVSYSRCPPCRVKHAKTNNSSANAAEIKQSYKKSTKGRAAKHREKHTEAGQAWTRRYKQGDAGKAATRRYKKGDAGQAAVHRSNVSDAGRTSKKKYKIGEDGRASMKRYRQGESGQAARKRHRPRKNAVRRARRANDPAWALYDALVVQAAGLASGRRNSSSTFSAHTGWSAPGFRNHLRRSLRELSARLERRVRMADHGTLWEIEHAIPQQAYDFDSEKDVRRCWSAANVRVMTPTENQEKGVSLDDELCSKVGRASWPRAWGGRLRTDEEKQEFYAKCAASYEGPLSDEEESEDESEEDEESDDEEEESDDEGDTAAAASSSAAFCSDPDSDSGANSDSDSE